LRTFCVFLTAATCLSLLSGCGAGNLRQGGTSAETTGSIAIGYQVATRGAAKSGDPNDLGLEDQPFREANFGLGDPGVTVISSDQGGNIIWYERKYFGAGNGDKRWAVDGYCNSACTLVLGTGRVCATSRAQFGFHAAYTYYGFVVKVIVPHFTYMMYRHSPENVKDWIDMHHAMDQTAMTMMRQPEVAKYVPSCRI
jgi:hypothetical protein